MSDTTPPILFIVFNRLDTTMAVFEAIARERPSRLYVAADGPRPTRPDEATRTDAVRAAVLAAINWPCEVKTQFQDSNLGCRRGVVAAIDWFFANEAEGIILEDDVVPSPDFFRFCAEMLERYRDNPRVMMVSGTNPLGAGVDTYTYFFSSLGSIWGWASWRDAWARYDIEMKGWDTALAARLRKRHGAATARYLRHIFDFHRKHDVDTWDTQWSYTLHAQNGLAVMTDANLIRNIGIVGTHSSVEMRNHNLAYGSLQWPLRPRTVQVEENLVYRQRLTKEILSPAIVISTLSQLARKFHLHRLMKLAYETIRATRSRQRA